MTIPPLRERPDDIPVLLDRVLARLNERYGQRKVLDSQARQRLVQHDWPGNVRELENVLERCYVASPGSLVRFDPSAPTPATSGTPPVAATMLAEPPLLDGTSLTESLERYEKRLLEAALERCASTYELAGMLGISQPTVFRRLRKYGLSTRRQ
ncbi:TyrR/PhhR family helix-turn-helix DNA-binding protein [Marinobacterium aestuariivivens]|uniref:TyrR/PhhR family helix-turn-helix DNA-binding protein n=1 Tax=Marinobacterium aestuariivivens TaxID=1698799 RepID=A0ABW2A958_9GAMM